MLRDIQVLFKRGPFHGPRLIIVFLVFFLFIFYYSKSHSLPPPDITHSSRPASNLGSKDIVNERTLQIQQEKPLNVAFDPAALPPPPAAAAPNPAPTPSTVYIDTGNDPVCEKIANAAKDIMLVVDTPSTQIYSHLANRLQTNLRCAPVTIFSTVSANLGHHVVHDALDNIAKETRGNYSQFDYYDKQKHAQSFFADLTSYTESAGRELHRWTVVSALVKTYNMDPTKKFYFLLTPTTYVSIVNLIAWTSTLDPASLVYAGAQRVIDDVDCAEIQPGVLLSQGAVAAIAKLYEKNKTEWEYTAGKHTSGDPVLALAMKQAHVPFTHSFPNMQADNLLNIEFLRELWCKSPVSWGSMTPALMDQVWSFETDWTSQNVPAEPEPEPVMTSTDKGRWFGKRSPSTEVEAEVETSTSTSTATATGMSSVATDAIGDLPAPLPAAIPKIESFVPNYNYSQLLTTVITPLFATNRTSWNNRAGAWVLTDKSRSGGWAHNNFEACRAACDVRANSGCLQWVYEHNSCSMGNVVRLGGPADKKLKSGWNLNRVKKAIQALTCDNYYGAGSFVEIRDPRTWEQKVKDKEVAHEKAIVEKEEAASPKDSKESKNADKQSGGSGNSKALGSKGAEAHKEEAEEEEEEPKQPAAAPEVEFEFEDEQDEQEIKAAQELSGSGEAK